MWCPDKDRRGNKYRETNRICYCATAKKLNCKTNNGENWSAGLFSPGNPGENTAYLTFECRQVRVVTDGIIGQRGLFVQRNLKFFSFLKLFSVETGPLAQSGEAVVLMALNKDHNIAFFIPSCFNQERGIDNNGLGIMFLLDGGDGFLDPLEGAGMNDAVKKGQFGGVTEDYASQGFAIDPAIGEEDGITEPAGEDVLNFSSFKHLVGDGVGVDDGASEFCEKPGCGALARTDAAEYAYEGYFVGAGCHFCIV
jgi:hypothetical protein